MSSFSVESRSQNIENFKTQTYDLVIVGGGINGAGLARDAASRGMSVALIEMNDFASGTSSRSSKLIHGGIRYLENLEFHLVYEALAERALLFELAPHLVHPLRFLLPLYEGDRVGMFKMGLGMWLYDILSLFEAPQMHEKLNVKESLKRIPVLKNLGLKGSYEYSDAYMDDDRLVLATLRSANELGAQSANYVSATGAELKDGKLNKIKCRDELTGEEFELKGQHFVSTVGAWTDRLGSQILDDWSSIMRPSKGIHLTLSRKDLPLNSAVVMASNKDQRIIFGIPRHEMVIIGTTDTDFSGDPNDVRSTKEDVDYLLKIVDEYFPGAKLTNDKIIASYAGVRPLVADGSTTESGTSREHTIINDSRNITFVAGGKYTTYRKIAEEAVESLLTNYSIEDQVRFARSNTKVPLNPKISSELFERAQVNINKWAAEVNITEQEMAWLVSRHGEEVLGMGYSAPGKMSATGLSELWKFEVDHAINNAMCLNLADFYLRRVPLFLAEKDHGLSLLENLANYFSQKLSWSDRQRAEQCDAVRSHISKELSWKGL